MLQWQETVPKGWSWFQSAVPRWGVMLLLLVFLPLVVCGQDSTAFKRRYSAAQLRKDLDVMNRTLRKCHPQYDAYVDRATMDAFYDSLKTVVADSMDEFRFRYHVRQAVAKVGCGHIGLLPSKPYEQALKSIQRLFLPLEAWIIDDRVYVQKYLGADSVLQPGDEVLKINGRSVAGILDTLKRVAATDGFSETHKLFSLERAFAAYHAICFGFSPVYAIDFRDGTGLLRRVEVQQVLATTFKKQPEIRTGWVVDSSHTRYRIDSANPKLAVLDIDRFTGQRQNRIFRAAFKDMRRRDATGLVIDLRGNPGGNVFHGNRLLQYLLKGPLTRLVFIHRWRPTLCTRHTRASFMERFTPFMFAANPIMYPRRGGWAHEFWFLSKGRNRFRGDVFVLADGGTFSMASYVTSYLKHKRKVTVIGEETGGGEAGSNGMAGLDIVLPNTGVRVTVNLYHIHHPFRTHSFGHGVLPDIPMAFTLQDRLLRRDPMMEKARELSLSSRPK